MRIGIVSPYSFDVPGGLQNHIMDLAEGMAECETWLRREGWLPRVASAA